VQLAHLGVWCCTYRMQQSKHAILRHRTHTHIANMKYVIFIVLFVYVSARMLIDEDKCSVRVTVATETQCTQQAIVDVVNRLLRSIGRYTYDYCYMHPYNCTLYYPWYVRIGTHTHTCIQYESNDNTHARRVSTKCRRWCRHKDMCYTFTMLYMH
jgi:hypothetical protein